MILVAVFIVIVSYLAEIQQSIRVSGRVHMVCSSILYTARRLCYLLYQIYELREIEFVDRSGLYMDHDFVP